MESEVVAISSMSKASFIAFTSAGQDTSKTRHVKTKKRPTREVLEIAHPLHERNACDRGSISGIDRNGRTRARKSVGASADSSPDGDRIRAGIPEVNKLRAESLRL